ncbi:MAG: CPBP family intramembrane metalloprotease [Paraprevotella sp.]|nr:CPBP family intramembrane metalloprotease [Paraprevotella sp.]
MKRTICLIFIFLLAQLLSSMVVMFFFNLPTLLHKGQLDVNALAGSPSAVGLSLLLNGALVWAVMTLLRWTDRRSFRLGSYGWKAFSVLILGLIPVIFIVNLLLETLSLEDLNKEFFTQLVYNPWGVLAIVLVGPFSEELVFRMGIQRHLIRSRLTPWLSILLSGLIFGIVHINPAQIPGAAVFGLVLGWLYWRSGTIWVPVAAHIFNNLIGVVMIWCSGDSDLTMADLCGGGGLVWLWAVVALVIGYCFYRYLDERIFSRSSLNEKERDSDAIHS